jgi:pentatricopeptide repeat protein
MKAFFRVRHYTQVLDVFEGMVADGFEPDAMVFDLVLQAYLDLRDFEGASKVLERWEDLSGDQPRAADNYRRLSEAGRERIRDAQGVELDSNMFLGEEMDDIDQIQKISIPTPEPKEALKNTGDPALRKKRMQRYMSKGHEEDAAQVLQMKSQKFMFIPAFTFEQFIIASVIVGRKESAIAIITEMIVRGLKPTRRCFKSIIGILVKGWDTRTYDFYIAMLEYGFMPDEGDTLTGDVFRMLERNLDELGLIRFLQVLLGLSCF